MSAITIFLILLLWLKKSECFTLPVLQTTTKKFFSKTFYSSKLKFSRFIEGHTFRSNSNAIDTYSSSSSNNTSKVKFPIPEVVRKLSFCNQAIITLLYYYIHVTYLSQNIAKVKIIGLDSVVGILSLLLSVIYHIVNKIPFSLDINKVPWRRPKQKLLQTFGVIALLFALYVYSGILTPVIDSLLNIISIFIPLTIPMSRNLLIVIAHFIWVIPGTLILNQVDGFYDKFGNISMEKNKQIAVSEVDNSDRSNGGNSGSKNINSGSDIDSNNIDSSSVLEINSSSSEDSNTNNENTSSDNVSKINKKNKKTTSKYNDINKTNYVNEINNRNEKKEMKQKKIKIKIKRYGRLENLNFFKRKEKGSSDWMSLRLFQTNWVWWVIGGYSVSVLLFNISDYFNCILIPSIWFENEKENIVNQMIKPEGNDLIALLIGSIAPCFSAPMWEEIFYRGLIYPFLTSFLPISLSTPLSAVIFAAHHSRKDVFLPLFTLGFLWAFLYVRSGNLFVTVVVHAMWNSRVFLGSFLGY